MLVYYYLILIYHWATFCLDNLMCTAVTTNRAVYHSSVQVSLFYQMLIMLPIVRNHWSSNSEEKNFFLVILLPKNSEFK